MYHFIFRLDYVSYDFNVQPFSQRVQRRMSILPASQNTLSQRRISVMPGARDFISKLLILETVKILVVIDQNLQHSFIFLLF